MTLMTTNGHQLQFSEPLKATQKTFDCHKWHVQPGEAIKTGDVLLEVLHDNFFTTTVRAKQSGYLAKMLVNENTSKKIPSLTMLPLLVKNIHIHVHIDKFEFCDSYTLYVTVAQGRSSEIKKNGGI